MKRDQAISLGLKKYFTGKPCSRGHISERYVKSGQCVKCTFENVAAHNRKKTEIVRAVVSGQVPDLRRVVRVRVHPDDEPSIVAYAMALSLQRGLT